MLNLRLAVLAAAMMSVAYVAMASGGTISAQETVTEPTGKLVVAPRPVQVGEKPLAVGFHVEPVDLQVSLEYSEHFVPDGESCADYTAPRITTPQPAPTWATLKACSVGKGYVRLIASNSGQVIEEVSVSINAEGTRQEVRDASISLSGVAPQLTVGGSSDRFTVTARGLITSASYEIHVVSLNQKLAFDSECTNHDESTTVTGQISYGAFEDMWGCMPPGSFLWAYMDSGTETISTGLTDHYVTIPNREPTVAIETSGGTVDGGEMVSLDATASDPDNDDLTYMWSGSGTFANFSALDTTWTAPAAESSSRTYRLTITVSDGSLTDSDYVDMTVPQPPCCHPPTPIPTDTPTPTPPIDLTPTFGASVSNKSWTQNTAITAFTLPAATGGDGTLTYSLDPALPAGVTLNTNTRRVSGTPTVTMAETTYTWEVEDANGDTDTETFTITVAADLTPTFGASVSNKSWRQNEAITAFTLPVATGGDGTLTYSLDPALPAGVTLNTNTRRVSGTPTVTMAETTYTWEVEDADGDTDTETFTITVTTPPPAPPPTLNPPGKVALPTLMPGDGSLDVSWSAPSSSGSTPITHYNVRYKTTTVTSWTGAGSVYFATTNKISDLRNGTSYHVQVQACNAPTRCGLWSNSATGTPLAAPTLDVTPLPLRKASLSWTEPTNNPSGTQYQVEIQASGGTGASTQVQVHASATSPLQINLDSIVGSNGLANAPYAYEIRIKATNNNATAYSPTLVIIDTPITAANGHSPSSGQTNGQAKLSWRAIENVLGDSTYAGGAYSFRYRRASGDHTDPGWQPGIYDSDETVNESAMVNGNTIESLVKGAIYAIQLRYEKAGKPTVYAARDVYVWPSMRAAGGGERVATFPLNYPVRNQHYAYRVCKDGFEGGLRARDSNLNQSQIDMKISEWEAFIEHATGQWQAATDGLVTMTYLKNEPCADYGAVMQAIMEEFVTRKVPMTIEEEKALREEVRKFLENLDKYTTAQTDDTERNEVIMVDEMAANYSRLKELTLFPEMAEELGLNECVLGAACAVPRHEHKELGAITDILLPGSILTYPPTIPGGDNNVDLSDTPFNTCPSYPYFVLVHESGHALGIRDGSIDDTIWTDVVIHHPSIGGSVMSYKMTNLKQAGQGTHILADEPNCSPHPFDIMAIYALYQSTVRVVTID